MPSNKLYVYIISSLVVVRMYARCQRETGDKRILRTVFGASIQSKGAKGARPSGGEKGGLYKQFGRYDAAETGRAAASYEVAASRHDLVRASSPKAASAIRVMIQPHRRSRFRLT